MRRRSSIVRRQVEDSLLDWLSSAQRVVIAGIGSPFRMDDFVGVEIVRGLRGRVSKSVYLVECETVPESFIQPIIEFKPSHILIIDAALLGLEPGSAKLIESDLTLSSSISTHALPLRIFSEYLSRTTGAKIATLAIQPKETEFGEGLTKRIGETAKEFIRILSEILPK